MFSHVVTLVSRRFKRDEEVVCYKELGCFRDSGPFDYLDMLPSPPEEVRDAQLTHAISNKEETDAKKYYLN